MRNQGTVCGPKNAITVGNSSVDFPTLLDAKAGPGLGMCVWLLCATGDKKIELSLNKFQREYPTDTLSVLDSGAYKTILVKARELLIAFG